MKSRRLEAILIEHGAPPAAVDAVTRALRKEGVIPVGGRGNNAADIDHDQSAWIMAVVAGAQFAARAAFHLVRLNNLTRPDGDSRNSGEFVFSLQLILSSPERAASVREVRVAQNLNLARILYLDGHEERFVHPLDCDWADAAEFGADRFLLEGALSGGLLRRVAAELAGVEATTSADPAMRLVERVVA